MRKEWTRDETIVAFDLYCRVPFNLASNKQPDIVRVAELLGRSASSVKMKIGNFGSLDPELKSRGIVGLGNTSKLDREVWDEFHADWEKSVERSEQILTNLQLQKSPAHEVYETATFPIGENISTTATSRRHQQFFRKAVLSAYDAKCCITGIAIPQLLIASHIKPWSVSDAHTERTNPSNGLCLNALHDKAFDQGLLTIDENYFVVLSDALTKHRDHEATQTFFTKYQYKTIALPSRFVPNQKFLEYHRKHIFVAG